jgi:hypothetical protein
MERLINSLRPAVGMKQLETDKPILIKFGIGKLHENLSGHFSFQLDRTILTTTLHKSSAWGGKEKVAGWFLGGKERKENSTTAAFDTLQIYNITYFYFLY